MAHSLRHLFLRLPTASRALFSPESHHATRCFSQSTPRCAKPPEAALRAPKRTQYAVRVPKPGQTPDGQPSKSAILNDIGLIPGTFITPRGQKLPSIFKEPRSFFKLQWHRIKSRLIDESTNIVFKWQSPKNKRWYRRTLILNRRKLVPTAVDMHGQMWKAFASGNVETLRNICSAGLFESLRARIARRARGETVEWELVKMNKRPRLASNRVAMFNMDGNAARQAVVRICSRQKLTRYGPDGKIIPGTGEEKDVVEYAVIDKKYYLWKEEPWKIWGTTEETTLEMVEHEKANPLV